MTPPLHKITWLDPCSPDATEVHDIGDLNGVHRPIKVTTLGWVLRSDEEGVTIANEDCGGGSYRGLTFIIRGLIVADEEIKGPRRRSVRKVQQAPRSEGIPLEPSAS